LNRPKSFRAILGFKISNVSSGATFVGVWDSDQTFCTGKKCNGKHLTWDLSLERLDKKSSVFDKAAPMRGWKIVLLPPTFLPDWTSNMIAVEKL